MEQDRIAMSNEKLLINNPKSNNYDDMSNKQIYELARDICQNGGTCCLTEWNECNLSVGEYCAKCRTMAERLYNAGYRKQNDEEIIDKIATYFEKEDNWTKLKYAWNISGKSVQLRDMLRDAITEAKRKTV